MDGRQSNRSFNQASDGERLNNRRANTSARVENIVSASSKRLLATASFVLFGFAAEVHAQNYPGFDALNVAISAYALNPTEVNKQAIESAKAQLRGEIKDDDATKEVENPDLNRARENITSGYNSIYVTNTGRAVWNGIDNSAVLVRANAAFFITSQTDRQDGSHDVQFMNNISAGAFGGAIFNSGRLLLDRVRFTENEAFQGGALYNTATATIADSHFEANNAQQYGGAILNTGTAIIADSHFEANNAQQSGGAIFNTGTAMITGSHFERNEAQYGGVIYNDYAATATITGSHFEGNVAQIDGGAILNTGTATITDSRFIGNSVQQYGGAIYNLDMATITNSHFVANEAELGGAIYNHFNATATIRDSRFEGNESQSGGAIYNFGTATITDSRFIGNSAQYFGGAIFLKYSSNTTLQVTGSGQRFLFSGNLAQGISNSIHLEINSLANTILKVDVADHGVMDMRDPMNSGADIYVAPGFSSTAIAKDGLGEWRLGGTSNLNFDQGKTNIDFSVNEGSLYLYGAGEVANANVNDANAKVEAGVIAINRQQGGIDGQASVLTVASDGTIVAAGENSIVVDGTINLAHGATIRGGTASDHDEGHTLIALGGETSLDLTASGGVLVEGTLNVAAVEERDTFRLNAALQAVPGAYANIVKAGAGTLILNGSENYTGRIDVRAGKLSIENQLGASRLIIRNGAVLAGNGTIGQSLGAEVIIASGGILAPGNSIGRLDIYGTLSLFSGSVYAVEIEGSGASDLTHVHGNLTIADGATMTVTGLDPEASYQSGQTYVVLSSANAINGAFTQTISGSAFLEAGSVTDGNEVIATIKVKSDTPEPEPEPNPQPEPEPQPEPKPAPDVFTRAAKTENQRNVAGGLNSLKQSGPSLALYNKLLLLSEQEARAAFDSLSGEVHASAKTAMLDDGGHIRSAVSSRLRRAFDDSYSHEQGDAGSLSQYGGWAQAYGSWSRINSDGNAAGLNSSVGGIVSGADALIGDVARFGLFAGYSHNNFNVSERNSSGRSDNYTLGAYLATKLQAGAGAVNIHAGLSHSWNRVHTNRTVSFRGFNDSLSADYNSRLFQVFGEVGYEQQFGNTTIEPYVNLAYVNLHSGAFTEHGTSATALSSSSQNMGVGYVSLGARAAHTFDLGSTTAKARLDVAWKHAYGDVRPSAAHAFQGSDAFTIYGAPIARDSLWVDAGLDFHLTSASTLGVSYQGQFGKGAQQNSVKARLNIGF